MLGLKTEEIHSSYSLNFDSQSQLIIKKVIRSVEFSCSPAHMFLLPFYSRFSELSPTQKSLFLPDFLASASSWFIPVPPRAMTWVSLMLPYPLWSGLKVTERRHNLRKGTWLKTVCYRKYRGDYQSTLATTCIIPNPLPSGEWEMFCSDWVHYYHGRIYTDM